MNIDKLIEQERNDRISSLNEEMQQQSKQLRERFELERTELWKILEKKREMIYRDLDEEKSVATKEFQELRENLKVQENEMLQVFEVRKEEIESDRKVIEEALEELKIKKSKTIETLKAEEKEKDELKFHKLQLSSESQYDIATLLEVEKKLNNKEVLRKLIYKTYVEAPMNEMFARLGIVDRQPGIYKIKNIADGKVYIGQSTNVRNRLREHLKSAVGVSSIASQAVHTAMEEEGLQNFAFYLLDECERDKLNVREKYWIDFYQSNEWGYNRTRGGS